MKHSSVILCALFFLVACGSSTPVVVIPLVSSPTAVRSSTPAASATFSPSPIETRLSTATPDTRLPPEKWQDMPTIPVNVSPRVAEIFRRGQELGNNPQAFSKIGDCEATPSWFLGAFDGKPGEYSLGDYSSLQEVIDAFHGSWGRTSLAAGRGFSSANLLTPLWADHKICEPNETPLACELRLHRPAFAFVMLGTNDVYHQDVFETNMRTILDFLVENGVVPILATKADNLEGDHEINLTIARLAYDYDLPLWNFWKAVQPLPDHGLQEDGSHLTWAGPFFNDPQRMRSAFPWRNLTALQILDVVWQTVQSNP